MSVDNWIKYTYKHRDVECKSLFSFSHQRCHHDYSDSKGYNVFSDIPNIQNVSLHLLRRKG